MPSPRVTARGKDLMLARCGTHRCRKRCFPGILVGACSTGQEGVRDLAMILHRTSQAAVAP